MISLKNIHFNYAGSAIGLRDINLEIARGELVVVIGPSGCGKTTLARLCNGLIPHIYLGELSGTLQFDGRDASELAGWEIGQQTGVIFQDPRSQFFTDCVQDELVFELENYGTPPAKMHSRLAITLQNMALNDYQMAPLNTLSSGLKQKVALAAAVMAKPERFVMDEPTANLDIAGVLQLQKEISRLKQQGKTLLIVEHRIAYLMDLADRIIYMSDGEIRHIFTPAQLRALPTEQRQRLGIAPLDLYDGKITATAPPASAPLLEVQNLSVAWRRRKVLNDINFTLHSGEVIGLTGANGCGKTTLARSIMGLQKPASGTCRIHPTPESACPAWMVMQDTVYQLFSDSVYNEMLLNAKGKQPQHKAKRLLKTFGLWELRAQHPATLSGGQKQRLTIALGLMQRASLIILDEPTSGLDGQNAQRIGEAINHLADSGHGVLIITHDPLLIAQTCQRLLTLSDGKLSSDTELTQLNYRQLVERMQEVSAGYTS